jgi:hypothetical protein
MMPIRPLYVGGSSVDVDSPEDALAQLEALVAQMRAASPELSKAQAFSRVYRDPCEHRAGQAREAASACAYGLLIMPCRRFIPSGGSSAGVSWPLGAAPSARAVTAMVSVTGRRPRAAASAQAVDVTRGLVLLSGIGT